MHTNLPCCIAFRRAKVTDEETILLLLMEDVQYAILILRELYLKDRQKILGKCLCFIDDLTNL